MSGHSHWAGIKYKKAALDAKRGKIWSKLARMIIVAAKSGGGDPAANLSLRYAIDKARAANMPKDTIEKAVKRGTAIMVEALTDNRNRTTPEVKRLFERHGGSLGTTGCVNWMFNKKGLITVGTDQADEDELLEIALAAGADDMENTGRVYEITCEPHAYEKLRKTLKEKEIPTELAEISMVPQNTVPVNDGATARKIISLMEALEDHEDVQNTFSNFDIPDEVMSTVT
jgi:transcriptional/translational regulatory protein YebC/TACO1